MYAKCVYSGGENMETVEMGCDGHIKWHWYNVASDLNKALGSESVSVDPFSVGPHGCGGTYNGGNKWFTTWVKNTFLLVSMQRYDQQLVDAFSKVVEYKPFCKYVEPDSKLITVEWDKKDPKGRFAELQQEGEKEGLEGLV
jgi:hypothetical protein